MALFLFVLFALGYVFGLLLKNPTAGKFLIFGFVGIFVYEPVKEAGLLASAVFLVGIISHHVTPSSILESLPRFSLLRRTRPQRPSRLRRPRGQRKSAETTEQTHERYEEYVKRNRGGEKAEVKEEDLHHRRGYTSRNPEHQRKKSNEEARRSKPQAGASAAQDELRRAREQLKREQDRLEAERREFMKQQQECRSPPDTRIDEEILGVSGEYSLAELKKARNAEVKRWNTSNMVNKPVHLIEQAEEEMKKINLAYERLVAKFR